MFLFFILCVIILLGAAIPSSHLTTDKSSTIRNIKQYKREKWEGGQIQLFLSGLTFTRRTVFISETLKVAIYKLLAF